MDHDTLPTLALLADAHHLAILSGIDPDTLAAGHPLDYPAHMVLREIYRHQGPDATEDFLARPDARAALLGEAIRRLESTDYQRLAGHGITPDTVTTSPREALQAAQALLPGTEQGRQEDDLALWANTRSFAALRIDEPAAFTRYGHRFRPTTEIAASSYGRGYYAFSVPGNDGFLMQPAAIAVVARVYAHLARTSPGDLPSGLTAAQRIGIGRLTALDAWYQGPIEDLLSEMFTAHEAGHTLRMDGYAPLRDLLTKTGHDPDEAFQHGFPTPHQLKAWSRLQAGAASTADITFVLGDALANATSALALPPGDPISAVRAAYLWQIISPPRPTGAPRGIATSLRLEERIVVDELLDDLTTLFQAAHTQPATVAQRIQALEHTSWALLQQHTSAA
ncbi:hypothetical protein ACWD0J_20850 [Streptomyces sp. NPDC003011]